jgi:hypothetical protein
MEIKQPPPTTVMTRSSSPVYHPATFRRLHSSPLSPRLARHSACTPDAYRPPYSDLMVRRARCSASEMRRHRVSRSLGSFHVHGELKLRGVRRQGTGRTDGDGGVCEQTEDYCLGKDA